MIPERFPFVFFGSVVGSALVLRFFERPTYPWWIWGTLACAGLIGVLLLRKVRSRSLGIATIIALFGIALTIVSVSRRTPQSSPTAIAEYAHGSGVLLSGWVSDEPDPRARTTLLTVDVTNIETVTGGVLPVSGRVLVSDFRRWPEFAYGDRLAISGTLERAEPLDRFRYDRYLLLRGITATLQAQTITRISPGEGSRVFAFLLGLKSAAEDRLALLFPEPHAAFAAGLITGARRSMPDHVLEDFRRTGLMHIVAISGYNITLVIVLLSGILFWLPLRWRTGPAIAAICAFTLLVGASASVVRASIMGILGLLALHWGRKSDARLALGWALSLMILWNPRSLADDASFQLSFLAIAGMVECGAFLQEKLRRIPGAFGLRETLVTTLAVEIAVVPFSIWLFGLVSLSAPLANILVAPLLPFAMLGSALALGVGTLSLTLGRIVAYVAWAFLELILEIARVLSAIPGSAFTLPGNGWVVLLYYVGLVTVLVWWKRRTPTQPMGESGASVSVPSPP